jgi:hypothetical protein
MEGGEKMLFEITRTAISREILAKNEEEATENFWEKIRDEEMEGDEQETIIVNLCEECKNKENCKQEDCEGYVSEREE